MAKQSLFSACKRVFRDGISGTYTVGNNDIFLELYSQQDIDQNNEIGNSSEENIVVVAGDTITIPEGYTLIPVKPKKSLVIICNTFVNNGTVSMYQKAPNVLPHDLFIINKNEFGGNKDVIIPAYANNQKITNYTSWNGENGNDGTNRNCGSGGTGSCSSGYNGKTSISGSGYAFGGGAGSGGSGGAYGSVAPINVDQTYPMRGSDGVDTPDTFQGGVGNPSGLGRGYRTDIQNFGCGGRIIVFCNSFENNGTITVNGTDTRYIGGSSYSGKGTGWGGASGAGAVDLFYTTFLANGTITANGGNNYTSTHSAGKGGNGSITLTPWVKSSVLKPIAKYMSKENMVYFLTNYIERLKQGED